MLESIILGEIPGTNLQLNFISSLIIVEIFLILFYFYKHKKLNQKLDKKIDIFLENYVDFCIKELVKIDKKYVRQGSRGLVRFWSNRFAPKLKLLK